MDLSYTDRSAVRLGFGSAFLLSPMPVSPVTAGARVRMSGPSGLSAANMITRDTRASDCELSGTGPVCLAVVNAPDFAEGIAKGREPGYADGVCTSRPASANRNPYEAATS